MGVFYIFMEMVVLWIGKFFKIHRAVQKDILEIISQNIPFSIFFLWNYRRNVSPERVKRLSSTELFLSFGDCESYNWLVLPLCLGCENWKLGVQHVFWVLIIPLTSSYFSYFHLPFKVISSQQFFLTLTWPMYFSETKYFSSRHSIYKQINKYIMDMK